MASPPDRSNTGTPGTCSGWPPHSAPKSSSNVATWTYLLLEEGPIDSETPSALEAPIPAAETVTVAAKPDITPVPHEPPPESGPPDPTHPEPARDQATPPAVPDDQNNQPFEVC